MKRLVVYFSTSGQTADIAKKIAEVADADIYEIRAALPYTKKDLDWHDPASRTSVEMGNPGSRPELLDKDAHVEEYDSIFLGFPVWWYREPSIVDTFLESYDFSGKKIAIFATSGSVGLGDTEKRIQSLVGDKAKVLAGRRFMRETSVPEIKRWIEYLGI